MQAKPKALLWLRRDLRLDDHSTLALAESSGWTSALAFVFDRNLLAKLPATDRRISFFHAALREIDQELRQRGSALLARTGDPVAEIPRLAEGLGVQVVAAARDFEPYAKKRDTAVAEALRRKGISFQLVDDQVIFPGENILSGAGSPYQVFTPYKNAWLAALRPAHYEKRGTGLPPFLPRRELEKWLEDYELPRLGFEKQSLWLEPGPAAARKRLKQFERKMGNYEACRNLPAEEGTSGLSAHLRFGTISVRACVRAALAQSGKGAETWLSELVWRDFYQMVLDCFPQVGQGKAFRPGANSIDWPGKREHFHAWREGRTGFPIIDAAMRHFARTGWMHNRLRMVVASFLTKDLLVDWREGERYFAEQLLDFDLAANNGGWQWSASTGCDAQPYFRVFNPESQSRKFDPEGAFLRAELPELRSRSAKEIHAPPPTRAYPAPIVDHAKQRERAIALFRRG